MHSQFSLLKKRRFAPFFITQFLGAFNDNLFKNALVVLLTFQAASWTSLKIETLGNLAAGIFILPFFLFSASAGQLADKFDKAMLARLVKILEMGIMAVAGLGFYLHSFWLLMAALFLLGCHSALFGPVKYAILPQHLREDELVGGNALIEAGTFISILLGTLAGGVLAGTIAHPIWIAAGAFLIALLGYGASRLIPAAPPPAPDLRINPNPFTETWRNIQFARENRSVFLSILGISWFWLYGAIFLAQFPAYARNVLGGTEMAVTLLLAVFTLGIGVGSLLCERLSGKQVEIGLVPLGSIGLTLFGLDLTFASPASVSPSTGLLALVAQPWMWRILLDLLFIGVFGGFFIVPLYTLVQLRSSQAHRARIIAANNIVNALFMVLGSAAAALLLARGMSIPALFGLCALWNGLVALYIYLLVPEFLLRFIAWMLVRTVYRVDKSGLEHIPVQGEGGLLLCRQRGWLQGLIVISTFRQPLHFVVDRHLFKRPILGRLLRRSGAIAADWDREAVWPALQDELAQRLNRGELVALIVEPQDAVLVPQRFIEGLFDRLRDMPTPAKKVLTVTVHKMATKREGNDAQKQAANASARPPHFVLQISAMQADALFYVGIAEEMEGLE
ncbi:MAG: MFS transporter [bacterium]|nr:MFS transporter [bacterium]